MICISKPERIFSVSSRRFVHQELENTHLGVIIKIHKDGKVTLQEDKDEYDEIIVPASTIFKAQEALAVTRNGDTYKPLTVSNHDVKIEVKSDGAVQFTRNAEDMITVPSGVIYKAVRMLRVTKSIKYDDE